MKLNKEVMLDLYKMAGCITEAMHIVNKHDIQSDYDLVEEYIHPQDDVEKQVCEMVGMHNWIFYKLVNDYLSKEMENQ
jgi:hypothetical protein